MAIKQLEVAFYEIPAIDTTEFETEGPVDIHYVPDSHARIKDGRWDGASALCGKMAPDEKSGFRWTDAYRRVTCTTCIRKYVQSPECHGWFLSTHGMDAERIQLLNEQLGRLRGAHFTNLLIRKDGQDLNEEADWIKHLVQI